MALQENSSEINISSSLKKKLFHALRSLYINYRALPFIGALLVGYKFMEISVVSNLMYYITNEMEVENQRITAIYINLQDALSSLFFVIASQSSEVYTGCFTMITFCAAASIEGLMLLWTSASDSARASGSATAAIFAAISFLAIGQSGQNFAKNFLKYQLEEKFKAKKDCKLEDGSTLSKKEQILMRICLFALSFVVYIITLSLVIVFHYTENYYLFRFTALLMGGTHLLFLFGSLWYIHKELLVENDLKKIHRIFHAAASKYDVNYPTSPDGYYWKDYKQDHLYHSGEGLRLLPRVPWPFKKLDKAAIIKAEEDSKDSKDPIEGLKMQEKKGKICTVKEVREVKSLIYMICLGLTIFPYSLLIATGNTFFVAQASELIPAITNNDNDIKILFLIKSGAQGISEFACFLISFAFGHVRKFRAINFMLEGKGATIIRIGIGIVCAISCSLVAWEVEVHRLSFKMRTTVALVPQFILLGMTEGLVEEGLTKLFHDHVPKSLWTFEDLFTEFVTGAGKLVIIPIIFIFSGWLKETMENSHLDRYYLMLGILNAVLFVAFVVYSYKYAYKEVCPEDEKVTPRLDHALQQELELMDLALQQESEDSYWENILFIP